MQIHKPGPLVGMDSIWPWLVGWPRTRLVLSCCLRVWLHKDMPTETQNPDYKAV